ncbi:MAG: energy transducer TonB [Candidatus Sulfotelmatobacter sp.]
MLELNPRSTNQGSTNQGRNGTQNRQPRRLMLALGILLIALVALLVKDHTFWFGSAETSIESDMQDSNGMAPTASRTPVKSAARKAAHKAAQVEQQPADAPGLTMTRTVLPPLDVEVVAGDKHKRVHPGTNLTHVDIPDTPSALAPATNAAEREPIQTQAAAAPAPQANQGTTYPLLSQHTNVQGSVVLQAIISAQGNVQDLRVLSGPAILSAAAQQAVREWRFKPVVQNGQAVETKARITVNFSIKVADNAADTTLAESRASDVLIISR